MGEYTVKLSEVEEKALSIDLISIPAWINNAIHEKARRCINTVVTQCSDKQPGKLLDIEKEAIVKDAIFKTAQERQAELEANT